MVRGVCQSWAETESEVWPHLRYNRLKINGLRVTPTRGNGRDVGHVCANVGHLSRLRDGEMTKFGLKMAILLRKWCTLGYPAVSESRLRSKPAELRLAALPRSDSRGTFSRSTAKCYCCPRAQATAHEIAELLLLLEHEKMVRSKKLGRALPVAVVPPQCSTA